MAHFLLVSTAAAKPPALPSPIAEISVDVALAGHLGADCSATDGAVLVVLASCSPFRGSAGGSVGFPMRRGRIVPFLAISLGRTVLDTAFLHAPLYGGPALGSTVGSVAIVSDLGVDLRVTDPLPFRFAGGLSLCLSGFQTAVRALPWAFKRPSVAPFGLHKSRSCSPSSCCVAPVHVTPRVRLPFRRSFHNHAVHGTCQPEASCVVQIAPVWRTV